MAFSVFEANSSHSVTFNKHAAPSIGKTLPPSEQEIPPNNMEDKVSISDVALNLSRNSTSQDYWTVRGSICNGLRTTLLFFFVQKGC